MSAHISNIDLTKTATHELDRDVEIAVLIISRQLSQAYAQGERVGDLLAMRLLKDAAFEKDMEKYQATERAIRIGMGIEKMSPPEKK